MKLAIHAHENKVWIRVWLPGCDEPLWFQRDVGDKANANAVSKSVEHAFGEKVASIRSTAYHRGRASMRDKTRVITDFNEYFCSDSVGYKR